MRRWIGLGIVALLGAGSLVAVLSSNGGTTHAKESSTARTASDSSSGSVRQSIAGSSSKGGASAEGLAVPAAGTAGTSPGASLPQANARVVKHATIDLEVARKQLDRRFATVGTLAEYLGGFVEQSDQSPGRVTITMRVPAAQLDAAMRRLGGFGRVTQRSVRGEDVSATFVDLDARIRNLTAQAAVLTDLMRQARTVADTITVQQQLSGVQQEIEQLTAQRNLLDDQSSFATVGVTMHAVGVAAPAEGGRSGLAQAWSRSVAVGVAVVGGTMVVLGAVIPLGCLAGLGFAGWTVVRRRRLGVTPA